MLKHVLVLTFIILTQPNGLAVYVNTEAIDYVADSIRGVSDPRAHASIELQSGTKLYVRESAKEIYEKMDK